MRYTKEFLLQELERITTLLGHAPSYEETRHNSSVSPRTFQRHFGKTWEDVKRIVGWKSQYELFIPTSVSEKDSSWLSGIIDGEGCFRIQKPSPRGGNGLSHSYAPVFSITLRDDDEPMLIEICRIINVNQSCIYHSGMDTCPSHAKMSNASPTCSLQIRDLPTLAYNLIPILESSPLRSKKKFEIILFKIVIDILLNKRTENRVNQRYTDNERLILDNVYHAISDLKKYGTNRFEILEKYGFSIDSFNL